MFRLWGRLVKENHLIKDYVSVRNYEDTRTHKVFAALDEICCEFDLQVPIWLDQNITDFQKRGKCRFTKDSFIEQIDFDYLEIQDISEI